MALLYLDSFESYGSDEDFTNRGWVVDGTDISSTDQSKFGTKSVKLPSGKHIDKDLVSVTAPLFISFYLYISGSSLESVPIVVTSGSSGLASLSLDVVSDGSLKINRTGSATLAQSSAGVITINTWHFIEYKLVHKNSTLTDDVICKVDGVEVFNLAAGNDTHHSGTEGVIGSFSLQNSTLGGGSTINYFDALMIYDSATGNITDFTGPYRMECLRPNGNGNYSQFTGSDADSTDNYLHVDETSLDGDTSYIQSSTAGHKNSVAIGNISSVSSILGVMNSSIIKKTAYGGRTFRNFLRIGGSDYTQDTQTPYYNTYRGFSKVLENNPATGIEWTMSDVNGLELGVEVVA